MQDDTPIAIHSKAIDQACDDDRAWFKKNPERRYRLRAPVAFEFNRQLGVAEQGLKWMVLVARATEIFRLRHPICVSAALQTEDASEVLLAQMFQRVTPPELKAAFARAKKLEDGDQPPSVRCKEALFYASKGVFVIPILHDAAVGDQSNPAAWRPMVHPDMATKDAAGIQEWWAFWPEANIGCNLGKSKLMVLEVTGHAGRKYLASQERKFGGNPPTWTARMGDSERRFYSCPFETDQATAKDLAKGLRVFYGNTIVVMPEIKPLRDKVR